MNRRLEFKIEHDGKLTMRAFIMKGTLWLSMSDVLWCELKDIRDGTPSLERTMIDVVWDPEKK